LFAVSYLKTWFPGSWGKPEGNILCVGKSGMSALPAKDIDEGLAGALPRFFID